MSSDIQKTPEMSAIEKVAIGGDLAPLSAEQRVLYYNRVCESLGLNPMTKPFEYIKLNGKITLYAKRDCADQLRKIHGVSIEKLEHSEVGGIFSVTAYARDKTGKMDSDIGAVPIKDLMGEARSNAMMKATTKAKRRVTLSICGLGWMDETEVESIHPSSNTRQESLTERLSARLEPPAGVDVNTGEVIDDAARIDALRGELEDIACEGMDRLKDKWTALSPRDKVALGGADELARLKHVAESAMAAPI